MWRVWAVVAVIALLAIDVAGGLLNFPLRLGIVRIALLLGEQAWSRLHI